MNNAVRFGGDFPSGFLFSWKDIRVQKIAIVFNFCRERFGIIFFLFFGLAGVEEGLFVFDVFEGVGSVGLVGRGGR